MASGTALFLLIILFISAMATAAAELPLNSSSNMYGGLLVGDAIDEGEEMMLDSEMARRQLGGAGYLSYGALGRNNVPCGTRGTRGKSYYNCRGHQRANPYTRGCTRATACHRTTR